jgi:uncharacterized peroxidase-related enzyme
MAFIKVIAPEDADGALAKLYERLAPDGGQVDQVLQAHSLRPHTLTGHMALYKAVMHHPGNELPLWFLETLAVWTSIMNACAYCMDHHAAGLKRTLDDDERYYAIMDALTNGDWHEAFDNREQAMLSYARALALTPDRINRAVMEDMHEAEVDDGTILEVNQVVSYYCYVNRMVLGLGITAGDEELGLSPTDDADSWEHS